MSGGEKEVKMSDITRILLSGCNGKMGRVIANCVLERDDCSIVAGIDLAPAPDAAFPVVSDPSQLSVDCDVIVDFSHPSALTGLLEYAVGKKLPLVLCTTGYSTQQVQQIHEAAAQTAVFYSGNMSLGINVLIEFAKKAAMIFGRGFDIEIIEKHHNQKLDAPSGTALMIADGIASVMEQKPQYVYDRHSYRKARSTNEIGIHSIRGGNIVGEHEVIFAGHDELFTLRHTAQSKEIFAVGAVNAALFMKNRQPGLYDMSDVLAQAE